MVKECGDMEDRRYLFEEDEVSHALAVMALPAIASQLITLVYNLADTWFVGRTVAVEYRSRNLHGNGTITCV